MVILRDLQASAESAKPTAADSVSRAEYENVMKECAAQRTAAQDLAARNATLEREYHVSLSAAYVVLPQYSLGCCRLR